MPFGSDLAGAAITPYLLPVQVPAKSAQDDACDQQFVIHYPVLHSLCLQGLKNSFFPDLRNNQRLYSKHRL